MGLQFLVLSVGTQYMKESPNPSMVNLSEIHFPKESVLDLTILVTSKKWCVISCVCIFSFFKYINYRVNAELMGNR